MNLVPEAPGWLLALIFAALAAAAIEDFLRLKISNITCLVILAAALIAMGLQGFPLDLWQNAVVFAVVLALGTMLFAAGKIGGGDVKLFACLGLFVSLSAAVWLVATTLLAGGALALIYLATWRLRGVNRKTSKGIPYGLAIVAGASIVFASQLGVLKAKPDRPNPFAIQPVG
jgi:prepilin peptidase CpaA